MVRGLRQLPAAWRRRGTLLHVKCSHTNEVAVMAVRSLSVQHLWGGGAIGSERGGDDLVVAKVKSITQQ